jgi:hypothetical protein
MEGETMGEAVKTERVQLVVVDMATGEIVPGWEPRPILTLAGGKDDKSKKHKPEKRQNETIDWARIGEVFTKHNESVGAQGRAMLDASTAAIKARDATIVELTKTIAERDTAAKASAEAHGAELLKYLELVRQVTGQSMEKLIADTQERVAMIESKTTMAIVEHVSGTVQKFTSGPIGTMLADRFLPMSAGAAAEGGAPGGEAALMRLLGKLAMDSDYADLMAAIQEAAGPKDWAAIMGYVAALGSRAAT